MFTIDAPDFTLYETEAEREERESTQYHAGYFADLAAFEGMGR